MLVDKNWAVDIGIFSRGGKTTSTHNELYEKNCINLPLFRFPLQLLI